MAALKQVEPVEEGEPSLATFQVVCMPCWTALFFCIPVESKGDYLFQPETQ